jgi:beta-phosphoglucomutase
MERIIGFHKDFIAQDSLLCLSCGGDGLFQVGVDGVQQILTPQNRKIEIIVYRDKTLVYIKSAMGHPAIYPLLDCSFEPPARAVMMDLDGTSVCSERFSMWIIERTMAELLGDGGFSLHSEDEIHVMGNSVSEHLQYGIGKFCPDKNIQEAMEIYQKMIRFEMYELLSGRGRTDAFQPCPGLKEFLLALKKNKIKIGLVTSGPYEKAWPEILSVFRLLDLGDPLRFYDAIITAGHIVRTGKCGTMGELESKPHPWLYAEAARVGLFIEPDQRRFVLGLEDSAAGIISIRLAGFAAMGVAGGNIRGSGVEPMLLKHCKDLMEALPVILGK